LIFLFFLLILISTEIKIKRERNMNINIFYVLTGLTWGMFVLYISLRWINITKVKTLGAWETVLDYQKEKLIWKRFKSFKRHFFWGNIFSLLACAGWYFCSAIKLDFTLIIINILMFFGAWFYRWWLLPPSYK